MRAWHPDLRVWGRSATLGNLDEARETLLGSSFPGSAMISADLNKELVIETLIPDEIARFPWAGHLGTRLVEPVAKAIESADTTLLFTNTRSQTELWFQELLEARPAWKDDLAMHHGSLDREEREKVEQQLREGSLRCVVCTSSLDLGVDFSPVDQVIQVGSPKGGARRAQRAGR
ncbi:MAG: DNA ligase-associated DEXH box helicase, partial [Verrucomicrobiales bacterium VVV1]